MWVLEEIDEDVRIVHEVDLCSQTIKGEHDIVGGLLVCLYIYYACIYAYMYVYMQIYVYMFVHVHENIPCGVLPQFDLSYPYHNAFP